MEKMNIPNEAAPVINKLSPDDITRCPNCNLIPSLKLFYQNNQPTINFHCENHHNENILLNDYLNIYNKYSLLKEKCNKCNKNQKEIKGELLYCSQCNEFLCKLCHLNNHEDEHDIVQFKRFDSLCKKHSNLFCFYCIQCQRNLCIYCKPNHEKHDLIDLSNFNYSDESKKILEEEMKNLENKLNNLDIIKQKIISKINEIIESSKLEMIFIKILLYTYQYEDKLHNLNYNVIQNIKNFEESFKSNKIKIYEKVYNEGNKYISFLETFQYINPLNNNFKILKNHNSDIYYLSQLKDGRLISCSLDRLLNIYKKDSYELQLSIKEHNGWIATFTQLQNGNIITCSEDQTMKLIKLINEDKYEIKQTLKGHLRTVQKVIELKDSQLLSISLDKTMKIWELNNEGKFECVNTIIFQNSYSNCNILKINENEFVTSSRDDKCIKFWNSNNFTNISTINNIETNFTKCNMCLLEKDILCVGGNNSKGFYLIQISTHQLIKNIIGPKIIFSIYKCLNDLILCSIFDNNKKNCIIIYKYENNTLEIIFEKENAHDNYIYSCIQMEDGKIASGGKDDLIKLWSN